MDAFSSRALGVAVMSALVCSQTWGAEKSPGPPMESLSAWVAARLQPEGDQAELRIALIGYRPDIEDPRLRPEGRSRVLLPEGPPAWPSHPDTEMVAWLRSADPRTLILAASVASCAGPQRTKATIAAIEWALEHQPRVVLINDDLLRRGPDGPPALSEALAHCWARACLPLTTTVEDDLAAPPGILVVSLISGREVEDCVRGDAADRPGPEKSWDQPIALCLSRGLLKETPAGVDVVRASAAYMALGAAALPAKGRTAHLERASLLAQVTPVCSSPARSRPYFRLVDLDLSAAPREVSKIHFLAHPFLWDAQAGDAGWIRQEVAREPDERDRRILAGVWGRPFIRHLNAAAQLAQVHPLYILSRDRGLLALRTLSTSGPGAVEPALRLLGTQVDANDPCSLFYSLSRDAEAKF